jgi:hypothetical protein
MADQPTKRRALMARVNGDPMSRALNINATQDHVIATCARRKVPISAIETLQSGGTRVVMNNVPDTAIIAKAYGSKVISGAVVRVPTRLGPL